MNLMAAKTASRKKPSRAAKATAKAQKFSPAPAAARPPKAPQALTAMASPEAFTKAFKAMGLPDFMKGAGFDAANFNFMEKLMTKPNFEFDHIANDAMKASRDSLEAFIKSGTIFAKGMESMIRTATEMTQEAAEKQSEYAKQMMGAKTLNELTAAQNKIAQTSFDEFMAGATKLSEMGVKLMNEGMAPLNEQMTKAMNKAGKMAA
jgi:phasin family protein